MKKKHITRQGAAFLSLPGPPRQGKSGLANLSDRGGNVSPAALEQRYRASGEELQLSRSNVTEPLEKHYSPLRKIQQRANLLITRALRRRSQPPHSSQGSSRQIPASHLRGIGSRQTRSRNTNDETSRKLQNQKPQSQESSEKVTRNCPEKEPPPPLRHASQSPERHFPTPKQQFPALKQHLPAARFSPFLFYKSIEP